MVNLDRFLKPYRDAGASNSVLAPHRFIDDRVFLTKGNHLGVALMAEGIDDECLTDQTLESHTRRAAQAWRTFDERYRIYQYAVKQDRAPIHAADAHPSDAVRRTVSDRNGHLRSKTPGLYTLQLVYVLLFEPTRAKPCEHRRALSAKKVLRIVTDELERNRTTLIGHAESFVRNIGDLLGIRILNKAEAFRFLRLLANLDPDIASAEQLRHDSHIDFYMASSPITCGLDGLRVGEAQLEILSLKESPHATFPNVLRDLLALETNFIFARSSSAFSTITPSPRFAQRRSTFTGRNGLPISRRSSAWSSIVGTAKTSSRINRRSTTWRISMER